MVPDRHNVRPDMWCRRDIPLLETGVGAKLKVDYSAVESYQVVSAPSQRSACLTSVSCAAEVERTITLRSVDESTQSIEETSDNRRMRQSRLYSEWNCPEFSRFHLTAGRPPRPLGPPRSTLSSHQLLELPSSLTRLSAAVR